MIMKLTSSTSADKSKIIKLSDLVLHHSGAIPEFPAAIFVITGAYRHRSAIADIIKGNDFKSDRQGFIGSPMGW